MNATPVPRPGRRSSSAASGVFTAERCSTGTRDQAIVFDCAIDRLDMEQTVERCRTIIARGAFAEQVSINAAKIVTLQRDPHLRNVVNHCEVVSADGQSIVWASRLLGDPLPERVAGIDLMHALIAMAEREAWGIYVLGARREVLEKAIQRLHQMHPRLRLLGCRDGYFADDESPEVASAIRDSGAQILFVAMSSPRKEYWLGEHGAKLNVPLVMGVGGSIDVVAGVTRRAPKRWQQLGMEWLYRLLQEPRRMFPRYLSTNVRFSIMVAQGVTARVIALALRRRRRASGVR